MADGPGRHLGAGSTGDAPGLGARVPPILAVAVAAAGLVVVAWGIVLGTGEDSRPGAAAGQGTTTVTARATVTATAPAVSTAPAPTSTSTRSPADTGTPAPTVLAVTVTAAPPPPVQLVLPTPFVISVEQGGGGAGASVWATAIGGLMSGAGAVGAIALQANRRRAGPRFGDDDGSS